MRKGPPTVPGERRKKTAVGMFALLLLLAMTTIAGLAGYYFLVAPLPT